MIGLGGGAFASFVQTVLPATKIDAVEIDPVVADAAGGVVAANLAIASPFQTRRIADKLRASYAHCLHLDSAPSLNDVLLLSDAPLPDGAALQARLRIRTAGAALEPATQAAISRPLGSARPCDAWAEDLP